MKKMVLFFYLIIWMHVCRICMFTIILVTSIHFVANLFTLLSRGPGIIPVVSLFIIHELLLPAGPVMGPGLGLE